MAKKDRRDRKSSSQNDKLSQATNNPTKSRDPCYCEARKHRLINNCLNCGRIVCQFEGSGRCFTCGDLVCSNEERELILSGTAAGEALQKKLVGDDFSLKSVGKMIFGSDYKKANKAVEHKNKLLEFDRISKQQTKIIDDQCDYHGIDSNVWLSTEQKQKLTKKQEDMYKTHNSHSKSSQLTIDFAGRKLIEEMPECEIDIDALLDEDESIYEHTYIPETELISQYRPMYCEAGRRYPIIPMEFEKNDLIRIQDSELQCMSDEGMCLSVHQPYASLIIAGIKKHEGRHWYTSFRGRLWIHAAAFTPRPGDIAKVEATYRENLGDISFPSIYRTGCLLGCIELTDCVSQEEYVIKFTTGECGSPYVLICENPQELKLPIPMKGKRRIFKMESRLHKAAKKTLQVLS